MSDIIKYDTSFERWYISEEQVQIYIRMIEQSNFMPAPCWGYKKDYFCWLGSCGIMSAHKIIYKNNKWAYFLYRDKISKVSLIAHAHEQMNYLLFKDLLIAG